MSVIRLTIRLKAPEDTQLLAAIEATPPGERNKSLKRALETGLLHGPTLGQALDLLATAIKTLEPDRKVAVSPSATPPKPDMAARKAALLGPFQAH